MTGKEFIAEIRSGAGGGYLLFGEEDFLKSRYLHMAKKEICPDETLETFNTVRINADSFSPEAVENAITTLPLMSERCFVEISGIRYSSLKQDEYSGLLSALGLLASNPQTVLAAVTTDYEFDPGHLPKKPSKIYGDLTKNLRPVIFQRPSDQELKKWICKHFSAEGIDAGYDTANELILRAGHDMFTLDNEIKKLCFYLHAKGRTSPDPGDIENVVCANTEADDFAFSNALRRRDAKKVFELLGMMESEKTEEIVILGMLSRFFTDLFDVKLLAENGRSAFDISKELRLNEYRVKLALEAAGGYTMKQIKEAIVICRNADLRLKSEPVVRYALIDRVTAELLSL